MFHFFHMFSFYFNHKALLSNITLLMETRRRADSFADKAYNLLVLFLNLTFQ